MKSILLLIILGLATILAEDTEFLKAFSDRYRNFTSKSYNGAVSYGFRNFAVCPTPLNIILAIIYAGVNGSSTKTITNFLQIPESSAVTHQTFSDLAQKLNRDDHLNFGNISKIYIQDGFQISNTYKKTLLDIFKGGIDNINFKQREKAVKTVNSWVYETSNQLISEIISKDNLKQRSTMLLISTMNFHGLFSKNLFKEESTFKRDFYITKKNFVKTDMMEATFNCSYYESEELDARFLQLNFTNIDDGSITFILPNDKEGLGNLESKINQVFIKPNYSNQYVDIIIPRFKIQPETFMDYVGNWAAYHVNFTGIGANQESFNIRAIGQNIIVEVDENGAGTTSVTYSTLDAILPGTDPEPNIQVVGGRASLAFDFDVDYVQPKPKIFQAHHPFIYYITVNDVNIVVGKFTFPEVRDENRRRTVPKKSLTKTENETKLGNRKQPTEAPMTYIVEEYTCPCNLN